MADDFGVGGSRLIRGAIFSDKMQQMQKRLHEQQDRYRRQNQQRVNRELELAAQWKERVDQEREAKKERNRERLADLQAKQDRIVKAAARREELRLHAEAEAEAVASEAAAEAPTSAGVLPAAASSRRNSTMQPTTASGASSAFGAGTDGGGAGVRAHARKKTLQEEDPHEKLQQRLGLHSLVNALIQSKDEAALLRIPTPRGRLPTGNSHRQDQDGAGSSDGEEVEEASGARATGDVLATQRHMAQKYRLRMMRQVASQMQQCRKRMEGAFVTVTTTSCDGGGVCNVGDLSKPWPAVLEPSSAAVVVRSFRRPRVARQSSFEISIARQGWVSTGTG
eukprot:TRINITY_DN58339_c0_g1_i1.p1 TRINITY_DN58339_c0_g1~~TRINITY_DN58339_c0_g1_i1.p1  ORF type:complete len:337 (-),score=63.64 TRINITY_DN58339_c0_g1_i1:130-1140(-)